MDLWQKEDTDIESKLEKKKLRDSDVLLTELSEEFITSTSIKAKEKSDDKLIEDIAKFMKLLYQVHKNEKDEKKL